MSTNDEKNALREIIKIIKIKFRMQFTFSVTKLACISLKLIMRKFLEISHVFPISHVMYYLFLKM